MYVNVECLPGSAVCQPAHPAGAVGAAVLGPVYGGAATQHGLPPGHPAPRAAVCR